MVISLCGNEKYKKEFTSVIKDLFYNRVLLVDFYKIKFNVVLESEKIRYKMFDKCDSLEGLEIVRKEIYKIIEDTTNDKINNIINSNKDKIILLIDINDISLGFVDYDFFKNSDIKILFENNNDLYYDKSKFDYVINNTYKFDTKKLLKEIKELQ